MWHEFTIRCGEAQREPLMGVLFKLESDGVFEDGELIKAYFPSRVSPQVVEAALAGFEGVTHEHALLEEQDWYAPWKERFRPFKAAGFTIRPPWGEYVQGPAEKMLVIDPGQAFGTGEHETTLTVLEMLMERAGECGDVSGERFLDLGTGTGILAIAACKAGFGEVIAVDVEQKAVETAARNFSLNGLVGKIRLMPGSIAEAGGGYDLIAANIFLEQLTALMGDISLALKTGGRLITSGILTAQEAALSAAAAGAGLALEKRRAVGDWVSMRYRR